MSGKSIGSLHAAVTANASQFINEFKQADGVARQPATFIDLSSSCPIDVSLAMKSIARGDSPPSQSQSTQN